MTSPAPVSSASPDAGSWRARGRARAGAQDAAWDREYGRDVWRLRELGITDRGIARISFADIPQPWLKNLAKRWARWRLSTGQVAETAALSVRAVRRFAAFLASPAVHVDRLAQVDRSLLERYLAHLHAGLAGRTVHRHMIGQLNLFFTAIRQHGWDSTLPTNAMFFPEDLPKEPQWLPRALSEYVMAQLERPDNLNRWNIPAYQHTTAAATHPCSAGWRPPPPATGNWPRTISGCATSSPRPSDSSAPPASAQIPGQRPRDQRKAALR
jgi:hypothetical protein